MATKRTPIKRTTKARLTPELRAKIQILIQLNTEHLAAIRGQDDDFYRDGRHEEELHLTDIVYLALSIHLWDDADTILQAALAK